MVGLSDLGFMVCLRFWVCALSPCRPRACAQPWTRCWRAALCRWAFVSPLTFEVENLLEIKFGWTADAPHSLAHMQIARVHLVERNDVIFWSMTSVHQPLRPDIQVIISCCWTILPLCLCLGAAQCAQLRPEAVLFAVFADSRAANPLCGQVVRPELRLELLAAELEPLPPEAAAAAATCSLLQAQGQASAAALLEAQAGAASAANGAHAPAANGMRAAPTAAGLGVDIMADAHGDGAAAAVGAHAAHASTPAAQRQHPADGGACNGTVLEFLGVAGREPVAMAGANAAPDSGGPGAAARSSVDPIPVIDPNPSTSEGGSASDAGPLASGRDGTMGATGHAAAAPTAEAPAAGGEPGGAAAAACGSAVAHAGDPDPASTLVLAVVTALQVRACAGRTLAMLAA